MAVNVSKTKYIIFRNKGMPVNINETGPIVYDDNEIGKPFNAEKVKVLDRVCNDNVNINDRHYKLLGLLLDEYLSFDAHCNLVCSKVAKSNYIINKAKNILPTGALKTLYFALVHPHLLYCLPVYGCTSAKNITKIEKMQKRAVRVITKSSYMAHTAPLMQKLKILPFKQLILYTQSLLVHSIYYKHCPPALHNTWTTNEARDNEYDLRNANNYYIPMARTEHLKRLPYFTLPRVWNNLEGLKLEQNTTTFKIGCKNLYLSNLSN
jgi:hypothetical protein